MQTTATNAAESSQPAAPTPLMQRPPWQRRWIKARRAVRKRYLHLGRQSVNWVFNRRLVAVLGRRTHVLCVGDSDALFLKGISLPGVWLHVFAWGGATASGLDNPNRSRQSEEILPARLVRGHRWQQALFILGGVDCSFVLWYHAQLKGVGLEELYQRTLVNYTALLTQAIAVGYERVIVLSAPLPTMTDDEVDRARAIGERGVVTATQLERTALAKRFNAAMEERCRELGVVYLDVTSEQLDPETGVISQRFQREDRKNQHLKGEPFSALIKQELEKLDW